MRMHKGCYTRYDKDAARGTVACQSGAWTDAIFFFGLPGLWSQSTMSADEDSEAPPFTPEQLSWIDRLVEARASALSRTAAGQAPGTSTGSTGDGTSQPPGPLATSTGESCYR